MMSANALAAGKKGVTVIDTDESPRKDTNLDALAKLRPALLEAHFALKDTKVPQISETFNVQFRAEFANIFKVQSRCRFI